METENEAELLEIGEIKISVNWRNIYLKFRFQSGKELWLYYSEHVDKPMRLKQINNFTQGTYQVGDTMTVNYKMVQSPNKSTKLAIINIANHRRKE